MGNDKERYIQSYELVKRLALNYLGSSTMRTPLQLMLGNTRLLLKELPGPINAQQRESLESIRDILEWYSEHVDVILETLNFVFAAKQLYISEINFSDMISELISKVSKKTKFQIEHNIANDLPVLNADASQISRALNYIILLIKQIHPTFEGNIAIQVALAGDYISVKFTTESGEPLQLDANPELFSIQSIAKLHGGKFQVESQDNVGWVFNLMIPVRPLV